MEKSKIRKKTINEIFNTGSDSVFYVRKVAIKPIECLKVLCLGRSVLSWSPGYKPLKGKSPQNFLPGDRAFSQKLRNGPGQVHYG